MTEPRQCTYCGANGHSAAHCPLRTMTSDSVFTTILAVYAAFALGYYVAMAQQGVW